MGEIGRIFWAVPLMLALAGCSDGLFNSRAAAGSDTIVATGQLLDSTAIQTQTLAPAPTGGAPVTNLSAVTGGQQGRVIGAPPPKPTASLATAPAESAAEIGAAAIAALKAGGSTENSSNPTGTLQSAAEAGCVDKGGRLGKIGSSGAIICSLPTADAGKACAKQTDCYSQCLAQSRVCAPVWPMFGCIDVVQNDGSVVTLCTD